LIIWLWKSQQTHLNAVITALTFRDRMLLLLPNSGSNDAAMMGENNSFLDAPIPMGRILDPY